MFKDSAVAWGQIGFRISLCFWLLVGHGLPKILHWIFGISAWGPHSMFVPKGFFSGLSAFVELLCPLMIIFGLQIRVNALAVASLMIVSSFALPFPWFHERISLPGAPIPFAIVLSKEIHFAYALAYLSLLLIPISGLNQRRSIK